MNAPKLVSQIIVVVAVIALLAPTVMSAIPQNLNGAPFSIAFKEGSISADVNENLEVELKMPNMVFSSQLPQDFKNVSIDVYFGDKDTYTRVGGFTFDTVPANGSVEKEFSKDKLSSLIFASYLPKMDQGDGKIIFPLILEVQFEYMEWRDTHLLDLDIMMQIQGTTGNGDISIVVDPDNPNSSTVTLDASSDTGLVKQVIKSFNDKVGDDLTVKSGDATFTITTSNTGVITVTAETPKDCAVNAAQAMKAMYEKDHKITFTADRTSKTITLEGDNAKMFADSLASFYPSGA